MKKLMAILLSFIAANAGAYSFFGKVVDIRCEVSNKLYGESSIVRVINDQAQYDNEAEFVAVIFDSEFYFYEGKFMRNDTPVYVDLSYTDKIDNKYELDYLQGRFGKKYEFFKHDIDLSYGGFSDVMSVQRRD